MKPSQIRAMLSQALGAAFKATPIDVLNGSYRVDISAGARLQAREAINKTIGVLETFLQSPGTVEMLSVQALKLDANAMFSMLFEAFGGPYKEQLIVPMDDSDKQRMMANTQAAAMQGKLGIVKAQGEVKKDVDNNQSENRMLIETGKHTLKQQGAAADHENELALLEKQQSATPQAQGLDRAAKGAFATMDKTAF